MVQMVLIIGRSHVYIMHSPNYTQDLHIESYKSSYFCSFSLSSRTPSLSRSLGTNQAPYYTYSIPVFRVVDDVCILRVHLGVNTGGIK
jgi:hypothetical protein